MRQRRRRKKNGEGVTYYSNICDWQQKFISNQKKKKKTMNKRRGRKEREGVTAHVQGGKPHWASLGAAGVVGPEIVENDDTFLIFPRKKMRRICLMLPSFIVGWMPPPVSRIKAVFSCLRQNHEKVLMFKIREKPHLTMMGKEPGVFGIYRVFSENKFNNCCFLSQILYLFFCW